MSQPMEEDISTNGSGLSSENKYIFDPESPTELARLLNQDRFVTRGMGGALAGLPVLPVGAQVLDVACGPGGWVLDVAFERSDIEVCGVDITHPLDFAEGSFDVIHARFLTGVLERETWEPFLAECTRLLRPGGILHLTEADDPGISSSAALEQLNTLMIQALWKAGYGFSFDGRTFGMSPALLSLLRRGGYHDIQVMATTFQSSIEADGWVDFYPNQQIILQQLKPLLIRLGLIRAEAFVRLYQQAVIEMNIPNFTVVGHLISIRSVKAEAAV